ncbi:MAG: excinuclease ABC subunit UvrC [Alphaproteobacteria bacterium]|nr:excinuclease ABC subunit UvrC [Alphaproteobacteria bacterium]
MSERPSLADQAAQLPKRSGVYLFKDARGKVLYVGKAKELRTRVRQYINGHDERFMVRFLVTLAVEVDVVVTDSEKEALILENTLIKRYRPRYNVQLRDDKNFLHLRLDVSQPWPRYTLVREMKGDGARYFGPYSSARKARSTLAFLQRSFPLRTCSDKVLAARRRPCLLHQMGRCVAPCVDGFTTPEAYGELAEQSMMLLEGRDQDLTERLAHRMMEAAEAEDFEEAARVRDLLREIQATLERQKVADAKLEDRDIWGVYRDGGRGVVAIVPVREGMMLEPDYLEFSVGLDAADEQLSSWINTVYGPGSFIPPELLLPELPAAAEALSEVLWERRGLKVDLRVPQRGEKARLVRLAADNARDRARRRADEAERRARALTRIAEICGLPEPPHRIECFDNSNIQGEQPVASQVVFLDGQPAKKEYRHYRIRTVEGPDDYASMEEVLGRRFRRAVEEGVFPDLLVVDGGKGQLNVALSVLASLGLDEQPVIGLAKPRAEKRRGEFDAVDKIVLPYQEELVRLADNDPALNLLRHVRDESHRFAVSFHRRLRRKSSLGSVLDGIPGIGPKRRKALLRHFGSARALLDASPEQIAEVPGIGAKVAEQIVEALSGAASAE